MELEQLMFQVQELQVLQHQLVEQMRLTKNYVDAQLQGLDVKNSVRVATTANGTLATAFANGQTVDGITLATNDRILLKDQSTGSENGIYTVNASGASRLVQLTLMKIQK